ncbi:MAG: ZIP family metal transporter [Candidatus Hadarchaeales archaeon]
MLGTIFGVTLLLSCVSFFGVLFFYFREKSIETFMLPITGFASGVLLSVAFLYPLSAALPRIITPQMAFSVLLFGFTIFFVLEKIFYWHHFHEGLREIWPYTPLNLLGDAIHNLRLGLGLAAVFLLSWGVGAMTAVALFVHAIPQELSDFALLLHGGLGKWRALGASFGCGLFFVVGGLIGVVLPAAAREYLALVLAGAMVYSGAVDLVPRREEARNRAVVRLGFFLFGIILMQMVSVYLS